MARWPAGARDRLERAALDLFAQRGYEQTTVAQIAERAGLTERSFYRHYRDKREVLFAGGETLERHLVAAIENAPAALGPLDALVTALPAAETVFRPRAFVRQRDEVIAANPALLERELAKLASLADALAAALARRGVPPRDAQLSADMGMSILRLAVDGWVSDRDASLAPLVRDCAAELVGVAVGARLGAPRP